MAAHPSQRSVSGLSSVSSDPGQWTGNEQHSHSGMYGGDSPDDGTSQQYHDPGYLQGFTSIQQKLTRDGQPAKRRGPKPDSKPAQTRRQELNRQAQRTHRERKEQYIKALETELARLREAFAHEAANVTTMAEQHELLLRDHQHEIMILRDILASRGIQYESELEVRKASAHMSGRNDSNISPSRGPTQFHGHVPAPSSGRSYPRAQEQALFLGGPSIGSAGHSPGTHQSHSPSSGPEILEQGRLQPHNPISDLPGIFEEDPQLGVDFILALEATCRGHEEYVVRRSVSSPSDTDEAMFSGHALMASCPPPSHIDNVPAQQEGLVHTYPHQVPQVPMETLTKLLNLSQRMKADGFVEGGQVTPIMALQSLRGHQNYHYLTRDDVVGMIDAIRNKVRCYGFGAVMEDFELRDALTSVFATKPEMYDFGGVDIDDMYS